MRAQRQSKLNTKITDAQNDISADENIVDTVEPPTTLKTIEFIPSSARQFKSLYGSDCERWLNVKEAGDSNHIRLEFSSDKLLIANLRNRQISQPQNQDQRLNIIFDPVAVKAQHEHDGIERHVLHPELVDELVERWDKICSRYLDQEKDVSEDDLLGPFDARTRDFLDKPRFYHQDQAVHKRKFSDNIFKSIQLPEEPDRKRHRKGARLTTDEQVDIYKAIVDDKLPRDVLAKEFNVSKSTVQLIRRKAKNDDKWLERTKLQGRLQSVHKSMLVTFLKQEAKVNRQFMTSMSLSKKFQETTGQKVSTSRIIKTLKTDCGMRFRLRKPQPRRQNDSNNRITRQKYCIELLRALESGLEWVSVDQFVFSSTDYRRMSWQYAQESCLYPTDSKVRRVSVTIAITQRGKCFYSFTRRTNSSLCVCLFLDQLFEQLSHKQQNWNREMIFVSDGASINQSKQTRAWLATKEVNVAWTAPYSFEQQPVEMAIALCKQGVLRKDGEFVDLHNELTSVDVVGEPVVNGADTFAVRLEQLTPDKVKPLFKHVAKKMRKVLELQPI